jgi:hypothetical protein
MPDVIVQDGPDKPALQSALAHPDNQLVHFSTDADSIQAQVLSLSEGADGVSFGISGVVRSGHYNGHAFRARYSVGSRSGEMSIEAMA